ncbi:MAG: type I secretion system permease/ATPase [Bauldia sp.]|nr:type I secretion system permease/ATPase [Bauldia sp.]
MAGRKEQTLVRQALRRCRRVFRSATVFSAAVNILMLAGPLYMLQIYDRVLASHSVPTLLGLTVFVVVAYAFQGVFDIIRGRLMARSARILDAYLEKAIWQLLIGLSIAARSQKDAVQPARDLGQLRSFFVSPGPLALMDVPFVPFFLAICFLIHPWLGGVALGGTLLLFAMAFVTERSGRRSAALAAEGALTRAALIETGWRNSESIVALGMTETVAKRWTATNDVFLAAQAHAGDVVGPLQSFSRVIRFALQSAILGLGAYLVIYGELTPGAIIAASIMMARALAPIEIALGNWQAFVAARQSYRRLDRVLESAPPTEAATVLPPPRERLEVRTLTVAPPRGDRPILRSLDFSLAAGSAMAVIGPSGSGKTSLCRTLLGVWRAAGGSVRLDGASVEHWRPEDLGRHVGYLAQGIDLFDGTVTDNIARMEEKPDSEAVIAAARAAGAHELILRLPGGYDTEVGEAGKVLSAGQRQRIALARALYRDPFLIVLDEPSANLDRPGEVALLEAVTRAKQRGAVVVMVAHQPSLTEVCDFVLYVAAGEQKDFGFRADVLRRVLVQPQPAPPPAASAKVTPINRGPS